MADKGKAASTSAAEHGPRLSRDSVSGILFRLPASDVHRCRFVSHEWEALANDQRLIAHYRRTRTPMPLFLSRSRQGPLRVDGRDEGRYVFPTDLNAIDIVTRQSRCLLRSADVLQASPADEATEDEATDDEIWDDDQREFSRFDARNQMYKVHGTCDGIVLMSIVSQLVAYNPFTRNWGRLPPLHDITIDGNSGSGILAFYASDDDSLGGQSRELRILYRANDGYHIHILGGQDYKLDQPFAPEMPPEECNPGGGAYLRSPVKHGDCLYWFPNFSLRLRKYRIVLFDTKAEKFRWIPTPSDYMNHDRWSAIQLLKLQEGLAMAVVQDSTWTQAPIELWVLAGTGALDYSGRERRWTSWSKNQTIAKPMPSLINADDYDVESIPPVFLLPEAQSILLPCPQVLVQCDRNWSVQKRYTIAGHWVIGLAHAIEESFVLHSYLDHNAEESPFVFHDPPTGSEEGSEDNSEDDDNNTEDEDDYDDDDGDDSSGGGDEYEDKNTEDEDDGEDSSEDSYYSDDDSKDGSDDEDQPPAKRQK